jgi:hypothetical protein
MYITSLDAVVSPAHASAFTCSADIPIALQVERRARPPVAVVVATEPCLRTLLAGAVAAALGVATVVEGV